MNAPVFPAIVLTAAVGGAAVGLMFDAQGWQLSVYGAAAAVNLAMCVLNIGIALKELGK